MDHVAGLYGPEEGPEIATLRDGRSSRGLPAHYRLVVASRAPSSTTDTATIGFPSRFRMTFDLLEEQLAGIRVA